MLFGHCSWSELPLSTSKTQELNGEIYNFLAIIDTLLNQELSILTRENLQSIIDQELNISSKIAMLENLQLIIDQQLDTELNLQ